MPELSLNILDVAQNSVAAGASLITVALLCDTAADSLTIRISDNGSGMSPEQAARVTDPFYTTRTTRSVGLGVPFFKMAAELTGGSLSIESELGSGTVVTAVFGWSHIDRMPVGDLAGTMCALIGPNPDRDFVLHCERDGKRFTADTRLFREALGGEVPLSEPEVLHYIEGYLREQIDAIGGL